jgi:hypothetical protein
VKEKPHTFGEWTCLPPQVERKEEELSLVVALSRVTLYHYQYSVIEIGSSYKEQQNTFFLPYLYLKTESRSIFETFWLFKLEMTDIIRNISDANGTDRKRRRPAICQYFEDPLQHNVPRFEKLSGIYVNRNIVHCHWQLYIEAF